MSETDSKNDRARPRRGKIASLPSVIREEVNVRLFEGQRAPQLLPWLNSLEPVLKVLDEHFGEAPIDAHNLSDWRKGGYADWLARRERIETTKALSDYALRLAEASGGSATAGGAAIAGGRILELLESATDDDLAGLVKSLVALRTTDLEAAKHKQRSTLLELKRRQVLLEETKFKRQTAELFIKWYSDQRAKEVVESKVGKEVKMEKLVHLMFGSNPKEHAANG